MRSRGRSTKTNRKGFRQRKGSIAVGRLSMNSHGYGFVVTEKEGPDVLVRSRNLLTALHGDLVKLKVNQGRNRLEGQILEVLSRGQHYISGTINITGKHVWLVPNDNRYPKTIAVRGINVSTSTSGKLIIAKITHFPETPHQSPTATIFKMFDPSDPILFETDMILLREGIKEHFSEQVLAETKNFPRYVLKKEKSQREDLRELDLVTIDPEDARDHDDAVWAERLDGKGYRIIVAISDVSHYVRPGSAVDKEALERGCTVYLPHCSFPMLPSELSNSIASLVPNRDRLTLAVEIILGRKGAVRSHRFIEGIMRSKARLHYEGVARALGLSKKARYQASSEARKELLSILFDIAQILRRRRIRRGALMFDIKEPSIKLDKETDKPIDIERSPIDPGVAQAYNVIEELMLLANQVVAEKLTVHHYPTIYRIHPAPDEQQMNDFLETARSLGYNCDKSISKQPKKLSRFLKTVRATEHSQILEYLLLRSMQQAKYSTENHGHFALALKNYLHFTSPIRRYPDLLVHRIVRNFIRKEKVNQEYPIEILRKAALESSRLERRALSVDREVTDLYRALLMKDYIGDVFDSTIVNIAEHGFYCCLDRFFVDVLCKLSALRDDRYLKDTLGLRLTGVRTKKTYAVGEKLKVRIIDVSIVHRQVIAVPETSSAFRRSHQSRFQRSMRRVNHQK